MSKIDDLLYKRCGDPKNTYYSEQVITQNEYCGVKRWNDAGTAFVFYSETSNNSNIIVDYIRNKNTIKKITFNSNSAGRTTKPTKIRTRVRAVVVG